MPINLDDLTIGQARELARMFPNQGGSIAGVSAKVSGAFHTANAQEAAAQLWEPGKAYLIRTVTMFNAGILVGVTEHEVILIEASWIPDTGRLSDALKKCEFNEVEPFPPGFVGVGRGAIIDVVQIASAPRAVK